MTNNKASDLPCNQSNDKSLTTNTNQLNTDPNNNSQMNTDPNNNSQMNTANTNSLVSARVSSNYYYNQQQSNNSFQQNLIQNNVNLNRNTNQAAIKNEIVDQNLNINQSHQTNASPINFSTIPMNMISLNQHTNLTNLQHHNLQPTITTVNQQTFISPTSQNRNTGSTKQRINRTNLNTTLSNTLQSNSKLNTSTNFQPNLKTNLPTNLIHFQNDLANSSVTTTNLNSIQTATAASFYDCSALNNQLNALQYNIFSTNNQINSPLNSNQPNLAIFNPPIEPINLEEQERIKLERKKIRNREAATKCRQKKIEYVRQLEVSSEKLKAEVTSLKTELVKNDKKSKKLLDTLNEHIKSGCKFTNLPLQESDFGD